MPKPGSAVEIGLDLDAVLDGALENPKPQGRAPTKTEQLRERREKLIALQAKGYTEAELAQMAGVSKDTLRKALRPAKSTKPKQARPAAHAARPKNEQTKKDHSVVTTPPRSAQVAGVNTDEKPFPTNDRF
jgi:lambda repressor-like predicted transcriptional regulator